MDFAELVTEVGNRGFNDLVRDQEARVKRWINDAHREICDLADWPFLGGTKEGTAPLTIEDLGHVLSISNLTSEATLIPVDRRQAVEWDPALDDTGAAEFWYRDGEETVAVYPLDSSSTFRVRYAKAVADLAEDKDEPLPPAPYHNLIVDGACVRAYRDRDNFAAAQFVRQEWERGIRGMEHALLKVNHDREKRIVRTGRAGDYL